MNSEFTNWMKQIMVAYVTSTKTSKNYAKNKFKIKNVNLKKENYKKNIFSYQSAYQTLFSYRTFGGTCMIMKESRS